MALIACEGFPDALQTKGAGVEPTHGFISESLLLGSADEGSSLGHCCLPAGTHTFCSIVEFLVFGIREYRGGGVVLAVLGHDGGLGRVAVLRYSSPFILITAQR